jgi:hypothetical protein
MLHLVFTITLADRGWAKEQVQVAKCIHELAELSFDLFQVAFGPFPDTSNMELFIAEDMLNFTDSSTNHG